MSRVCRLIFFLVFSAWMPSFLLPSTPAAIFQEDNINTLPRIVRLEPGVLEKMILVRKDPVLPPLPKDLKVDTNATLELAVDQSGAVLNAKAISVHSRLQERAIKAAGQWRFAPHLENGKPVFAIGLITLNFRTADPMPENAEIEKARFAVKESSLNPAARLALAGLYEHAERYDEAIDELDRVISDKPDVEEAYLILARIYGRMHQVGKYLKEHNAAVSVFYTSNVEGYIDDVLQDFCRNVAALPLTPASTFIRWTAGGQGAKPMLGSMMDYTKQCAAER